MKALCTVTEDTLSRRMGQDLTLRFTLYIMCKFINGKGEEKNSQQFFVIFSIDIISMIVHAGCVCVVF